MFEAHYLSESGELTSDFAPVSGLTRRLYSRVHQCPLHVWTARGKRKDEVGTPHAHWFVYVEYCRTDGRHGYRLLERSCCQRLDSLFDLISGLELPEIAPQRTREWLAASTLEEPLAQAGAA